uniref:CBFD_NFYB_HMF domain-containing protein n=1 Tax=Caenorhabditis tropicalis TaxID=1561998 RepID=A0A1I7TFZ0_9PELO
MDETNEKKDKSDTDDKNDELIPSELLCSRAEYEEMTVQRSTSTTSTSSIISMSPSNNMANAMMMQHDAIPPARYASMQEMTEDFWRERKRKMNRIPEEEMKTKTRNMSVPMARVKKIMRIDDDVRKFMISSDAPIFMAQAAEFFIEEMTAMGWQYVSEARRRILQKTDIATAVQSNDQFDFLIDFLPPKNEKDQSSTSQFSELPVGNSRNFNFENGRNSDNRRSCASDQNNRLVSQRIGAETMRKHAYTASSIVPESPSTPPSASITDHQFLTPTIPETASGQEKI